VLDIIGQKATCNRYPVDALPYCDTARSWLFAQLQTRRIPINELSGASLAVEYTVNLGWAPSISLRRHGSILPAQVRFHRPIASTRQF
jgi:hypothetical protein